MYWQQDQDPEISVEDVFKITLDVKPETTFEGDLEYVEDSEGEDYPISHHLHRNFFSSNHFIFLTKLWNQNLC